MKSLTKLSKVTTAGTAEEKGTDQSLPRFPRLGLADKATKSQECRQTSRYETDWRTGIPAAAAICQRERIPRHDQVASINLYNASGGYFYYRKAGQIRIDLRIRNHFTDKMCDAHLEDGHLMSAQLGFLSEAGPHKAFDERSAWGFSPR